MLVRKFIRSLGLTTESHLVFVFVLQRWKKERNVQEFLDDGSRVIMVLPEDPRNIVKKVMFIS